jgi:putative membrane protein
MITAATLTGLLALAPAFAQTATTTTATTKTAAKTSVSTSTLSSADRKFLTDASQGGMVEVELGKIAAQKASNPDVKSFGQRMVDDHSKANDQLRQVATSKSVTLSDKLSPSKQKEVDKYNKLSGAAFDSSYISHMVSDHKVDVAEFEKESKKGKDADVKGFATNTLPTLQDHLKMAQDISSKMHASTHTKTTTKTTTKKGGS